MKYKALGLTALTLVLIGTSKITAEDKKFDLAECMGTKLGLNSQQKTDIRKIHTEYEMKKEPVEKQLWKAHRESRLEMSKILTEEQIMKLPEIMKAERNRELEPVAAKLGLTEQQKTMVENTLNRYEKKFCDLSMKTESDYKQFVDLKQEMFSAILNDLNDEQRIRLPEVLRSEFHRFSNAEVRNDHAKLFVSKLALSDEQNVKIDKLLVDCNQRVEKPISQMIEMCKSETTAIENILTKEQLVTLKVIMKPIGITNK